MASAEQRAKELLGLRKVRERCGLVHDLAKQDKLEYFAYHPEKEDQVADYCIEIIKESYGTDYASIPPHGRWRHTDFNGVERVGPLTSQWTTDEKEKCRRIIDLFLVSVLLDAGAGSAWSYEEIPGDPTRTYSRSEGLGVAAFNMFRDGLFSGNSQNPHQVDAKGLAGLDPGSVKVAFKVFEANPMVGLEGRTQLLKQLSGALSANPLFFHRKESDSSSDDQTQIRPGNLVDYLETKANSVDGQTTVSITYLWETLITGLSQIWPARLTLAGVSLGDVWPCDSLKSSIPASSFQEGDNLVPFHKLTGWITYSLVEPMEKILGWKFTEIETMTGLPEYRNGGLLVDLGILSIKPDSIPSSFYPTPGSPIPRLPPSHPAIVEWRAMTVIELDRIAELIRKKLQHPIPLAQILESATWKGGRKIAKEKRPETGGPPIDIISDGTVF